MARLAWAAAKIRERIDTGGRNPFICDHIDTADGTRNGTTRGSNRGSIMMNDADAAPALSVAELERFLRSEFPQVFDSGGGVSIEKVWHGGALVRQAYRPHFIRPGGTISGSTMMALADVAMYVAVLASIGPVPLAVTTNLNINFLRKPGVADLLAKAKLMKLGKRLAVGEVALWSDGTDDLVAHVTSTYSIPGP
jgi:uncharacterized protein (TIGR00369 family)